MQSSRWKFANGIENCVHKKPWGYCWLRLCTQSACNAEKCSIHDIYWPRVGCGRFECQRLLFSSSALCIPLCFMIQLDFSCLLQAVPTHSELWTRYCSLCKQKHFLLLAGWLMTFIDSLHRRFVKFFRMVVGWCLRPRNSSNLSTNYCLNQCKWICAYLNKKHHNRCRCPIKRPLKSMLSLKLYSPMWK